MARGRLRIYLGAAPGVGKTVGMLAEGARRKDRGTDVVVGLCETHDRTHTAALLEGLEVLPRRQVAYRGSALTEMDLDGLLARRPQVALVDELAHTNVPGSRHEKRWQDIHELLAAGIDVISTVNIQHLESLNDAVESITGIGQRETVPDEVVRAADQIDLVDMSPEALRRRMAHGHVYRPESVDAALSNYFRVGNLAALRELALLWLADRVEEGLEKYRNTHGIAATWPTRERVVVALSGGPEGETLLRRGARIAFRGAGGEMLAVYVARTDGLAGPPLPAIVAQKRLAEELGGTFHTVTGDDPAAAVLGFARGVNASQIVVATYHRPFWRGGWSRGIADAVIAGSGDIDVLVVTHSQTERTLWSGVRGRGLPRRRIVGGFVAALLAPTALTATLVLTYQPGLQLIMLVYLLLTVLVALLGGLWPATCAAVLSSLLVNWFFTQPFGTMTIADPENALALVVFVLVGIAVSVVVRSSARRAADAIAAQQEATALAELTHTLLGSTNALPLLLDRALEMFSVDAAALVTRPKQPEDEVQVVAATRQFDPAAAEAAREPVDPDHDLVLKGLPVTAERRRLLAAFATHAGAILQRQALVASASSAEELARGNRARTALLSAVSHDLRTPLAGIKAAIGSLRSTEITWSASDEAELKEAIEDSADRLDALIGNLLDMSRLQANALVASPREIDLGEVIPSCVAGMSEPTRIAWSIGPAARDAVADPGLLDRVLGNLLENALRHQPSTGKVRLSAESIADRVEIRVIDTGAGVPVVEYERIFLPFQRSGDSPAGDGVGLGLAVARGFTEAMGGVLRAETTPGGGLTMVVGLPTEVGQRLPAADEEDAP